MGWFLVSYSEVSFTLSTESDMNIMQHITWDVQKAAWSLVTLRRHRILAYCNPAAFIS